MNSEACEWRGSWTRNPPGRSATSATAWPVGSLNDFTLPELAVLQSVPSTDDERNTPHRFELIRRVTVAAIDGSPAQDWETYATMQGWFTLLDAEELRV